jgi:hypothetical protein
MEKASRGLKDQGRQKWLVTLTYREGKACGERMGKL